MCPAIHLGSLAGHGESKTPHIKMRGRPGEREGGLESEHVDTFLKRSYCRDRRGPQGQALGGLPRRRGVGGRKRGAPVADWIDFGIPGTRCPTEEKILAPFGNVHFDPPWVKAVPGARLAVAPVVDSMRDSGALT